MLMLIDLPSPIHGMSVMNEKFRRYMSPSFVVNTAPSFAVKYFDGPIWLMAKLLLTPYILFKILNARFRAERICYRSLNGGKGQVIDLIYLAVLRLTGFKVFLHHHSFSYLSDVSGLFFLVLKVGGKDLEHIVLVRAMKRSSREAMRKKEVEYGDPCKVNQSYEFVGNAPGRHEGLGVTDASVSRIVLRTSELYSQLKLRAVKV